MPEFRYDGPSHLFKKTEDDEGVRRGATGNFAQALVDRYTEQGHRFTPVSALKSSEAEAAKAASKGSVVETKAVSVGEGAGTISR